MARRPVTSYAGGKGPRQILWDGIRQLQREYEIWTEHDLWISLPTPARHKVGATVLRDYRRALVAAGILAVAGEMPQRYKLIRDQGLEAPRVRKDGSPVTRGLGQEQMWRALRLLPGDINARELAAHAATPDVQVNEMAARTYLRMLAAAGYLVLTAEGQRGGRNRRPARYRLKAARNTGPRPPIVCRTKVVYDPNEDKIVWQAPVSDEDAI